MGADAVMPVRRIVLGIALCLGDVQGATAMTAETTCPALVRSGSSLVVDRMDIHGVDHWDIVSVQSGRPGCTASIRSATQVGTLSMAPSGIRLTVAHAATGHGWVCASPRKDSAAPARIACWPTDGVE
jgi:hypothetical protein